MVAIRANLFLTILNVLATLVLLALLAYFYSHNGVEKLGSAGYPVVLLQALGNTVGQTPTLVTSSVDPENLRRRSHDHFLPLLRGLLLALPVLLYSTWLLSQADFIFAGYVGDFLTLRMLPNSGDLFLQVAVVLVASWLVAGGLAYTIGRRKATGDEEGPGEDAR